MDIPRKDASRKRLIRRIVLGVVVLIAVVGTSFALKRLKPAPPSVDGSVVWRDTVKRGPITLERRGLGTLVPEQTMLVPATTDGRVERILIRPGTEVRANSIIMILSSPELETSTLDAEFAVKAAEADYQNLKVTLDKTRLDMQSMLAQVEADANTAKLQADRDAALAKEGLFSEVDAKISAVKAQELTNRVKIEKERLQISTSQEEAQLGAQKVKMEQLRGQYNLKKSQLDQLKVKAGFDGMLQQLPTPVEEGQRVSAGTSLGKIAQPSKLKAELKIAETQAKDVRIGQHATVDTRNGVIEGRVSRIDPSVLNGTVTVDVSLIVGKDG
ncbi:MAG TPA: HlyD family efflux transporter periplasmic adaptor subunit, partial [Bryobacteraceae bacterium]|nr:HlyD family efflux transporter periplasmic adaptor subunit [Bryobacteraceae bacterium]